MQPSTTPHPHPTRPASAHLYRRLPTRFKVQQRPASAAAYLRLTAKMAFPAHKQPSARAHGHHSHEAAHADALGSMLASIAESAAALDAHAPVGLTKGGNRKANGTAMHDLSPADNMQLSSSDNATAAVMSSTPDSHTHKPARSSNSSPSGLSEDPDLAADQQDAAMQLPNASAVVRPASAQPGVQSPGTFLRHARPQSAAAANVAFHSGSRAFWKGSQKRPGSSRPQRGVQAVVSQKQGKKVSHVADWILAVLSVFGIACSHVLP